MILVSPFVGVSRDSITKKCLLSVARTNAHERCRDGETLQIVVVALYFLFQNDVPPALSRVSFNPLPHSDLAPFPSRRYGARLRVCRTAVSRVGSLKSAMTDTVWGSVCVRVCELLAPCVYCGGRLLIEGWTEHRLLLTEHIVMSCKKS